MTQQEIADLLGFPYERVEAMCKDPDILEKVLAYAIACGIHQGRFQALAETNKAMKGYKECLNAVRVNTGAL